MSIDAKTRKKTLVQMLHEHGLSISYDRVSEISAQMGDAAVNKYVEDQVVCPPGLRRGLFTTTAMDNIDILQQLRLSMGPAFLFSSTQHRTIKVKNFEQSHLEEKRLREFLNYQMPSPISLMRFSRRRMYLLFKSTNDTNTTQLKSQLMLEYEWLEQVSVTQEIQGGSKKVSCCIVIDISMARQ